MDTSTITNRTPVERWASVGELQMRYLDWCGDGPPVLALHGLASSAHWYDLVAPMLSERFRVIAADQRGHGKTTQASNGYDWLTVASDAIGLMDELGLSKAAILGHSWGGNVAINVAAYFPERVSDLVLIDGGFFNPRFMPNATWESFRQRLAPRDVSGTREQFLDRIRRQLRVCWSDDIQRIVQTMVYEDDHGQIQDILRPENQAQVIRAMWDDPAFETWPRISCKTLIVPAGPTSERAGTDFARVKENMVNDAAATIPNNKVHWIPETVHDIGYHKPQELAKVILEFLGE